MKRPSPALVISCVALFASLGGTGYAATHVGASDAKAKSKAKAPKYVTKSEVNKLIASYVKVHKLGATGPQGPVGGPGKDGGEGKVGPQGPGAVAFGEEFMLEGETVPVKLGPWTLSLECKSGPLATIKFAGPGNVFTTGSIGAANAEGKAFNDNGAVEGFNLAVSNGGQMGLHGILHNGSTSEQFQIQATASKGLLSLCDVIGVAVPAS